MLPCPLYQLTGLQCPFCGVQRGFVALLHGQVAEWWNYNPVVWCLVPYFILFVLPEFHRAWLNKPLFLWLRQDRIILAVAIILIIWGIARNFLLS